MTAVNATTWLPRGLLIAIACTAIIALYYPTFADMVAIWWTSSTFNHCFLIAPIALYLVFENRPKLALLKPGVAPFALMFLIASAFLWTAGNLIDIAFFQHVAVVSMLIGVTWLLIGPEPAAVLTFPLFYLYFSVPEGEFLVPYLQDWTAKVLVAMLRISDMPVFIEGRYLSIPSGNFVVAEACSGINYLIATLSVGSMYAYLRFRSNWRRALFMLFAIAVPLVANGIRAYGIVMIAHTSGYKYALGVDHFIYGWVFFGVVIFSLFALGNLFAENDDQLANFSAKSPRTQRGILRPALPYLIGALVIVALPRFGTAMLAASTAAAPAIALPPGALADADLPSLNGRFAGETQALSATFPEAGEPIVRMEVHYFAREMPGQEVINQTNVIFNDDDYKQIGYGLVNTGVEPGPARVNEVSLRRGAEDFLLWYWYDIGGRQVATRIEAKLAQAAARLSATPHGSGAVVLVVAGEGAEAREQLRGFIAATPLALDALYVSE